MVKFNDVECLEVWVQEKHTGFIVDQLFFPAAGVQLGPAELEEIVNELHYQGGVTRPEDIHVAEIPLPPLPADARQASFMLDKKSRQLAKDRMHRRPVENDQSDSVSRSMKPSGDL